MSRPRGERGVDGCAHLGAVRIGGQFDVDFLRGVKHTDPDVHGFLLGMTAAL